MARNREYIVQVARSLCGVSRGCRDYMLEGGKAGREPRVFQRSGSMSFDIPLFEATARNEDQVAPYDRLFEISDQGIQRLYQLESIHSARTTHDHTSGCWWEFPR